MIKDELYKVNNQSVLLNLQTGQLVMKQGLRINHAEQQLRLLDPVNVLKRGYSITYHNGKTVRDILEVEIGDELRTRLFNGTVCSEVKLKYE